MTDRFVEMVKMYGNPATPCEVKEHNQVGTIQAALHSYNEGATWREVFICSGCADKMTLLVCDKYHETLTKWLDPDKLDCKTNIGSCMYCGVDWIYEETYKGGTKWG